MKKSKILLVLILQLYAVHSYSQEWIINDVTNFFSDKSVYSTASVNNQMLVLSGKGLYKISKKGIQNYLIKENTTGYIENHKTLENYDCDFDDMIVKNNTILLYSGTLFTILKIQNDSITNHKIDINFKRMELDNEGSLFVLTASNLKNTFLVKYHIIRFSKDKIDTVYTKTLEKNRITGFKVANNNLYILKLRVSSKSRTNIEIVNLSTNSTVEIPLNTDLNSEYILREFDDKIFILSSQGNVYRIDNDDEIVLFQKISKSKKEYSFDFIIRNNFIYQTNSNGLFLFSLLTNEMFEMGKGNLEDKKHTSYKNMTFNTIYNQLWLTHQLLERGKILNGTGISILSLK